MTCETCGTECEFIGTEWLCPKCIKELNDKKRKLYAD